ncbi:TetR/AcrR family transcriptional regulator [Rhodococcus rhodnii]|nr:TetR/AcrR family transcriptional regulator [Rhodococcus rhodnii]TXG90724.1 TetR/AcrR family transcriptional regulator [Rhodococcus rhodnii]
MSTTRTGIVSSAEQVFDRHGFAATGMDRLTEAAGVSTRTLYKHVGSKTGLVAAVLEARAIRFAERVEGVSSVDGLFAALAEWTAAEGARGCLFLRAQGETGGETPEVSAVVDGYRRRLRDAIARFVATEIGRTDDALADQILVLFEGATSAASYLGTDAIDAARHAAATVVRAER